MSGLTDRSVPASGVFGTELPEAAMACAPDEMHQRRVVEGFLAAHLQPLDPVAEEVAGIVERVEAEPAITRVDDLARTLGTSVLRLQRLFADYVGVGPKWVIRRYRLHEITVETAQPRVIGNAVRIVQISAPATGAWRPPGWARAPAAPPRPLAPKSGQ